MTERRVTVRIVPKGDRFHVPKTPGVGEIDEMTCNTLVGARHWAGLMESAAKRKGYAVTIIEEAKKAANANP